MTFAANIVVLWLCVSTGTFAGDIGIGNRMGSVDRGIRRSYVPIALNQPGSP